MIRRRLRYILEEQRKRFSKDRTVEFAVRRDNGEADIVFTNAVDAGLQHLLLLRSKNPSQPVIIRREYMAQYNDKNEHIGDYIWDSKIIRGNNKITN